MHLSKETPLHVAVKHNHLRLVEYLIEVGADPTISNSKGETALDLASGNHNIALLI